MKLKHEHPSEYDTLDISTIKDWKKTYRDYDHCLKPITEDEYDDWLLTSKRNSYLTLAFRTNASTGLYVIRTANARNRSGGKTVEVIEVKLSQGKYHLMKEDMGWHAWKAPIERIISEVPEYNIGTIGRWILDPITSYEIYNERQECFKAIDNYAKNMVLRDYNYMLEQLSVGPESVYPLNYYLNLISRELNVTWSQIPLPPIWHAFYYKHELEQYINDTNRNREHLINNIADYLLNNQS
jgi:hypothetical protein